MLVHQTLIFLVLLVRRRNNDKEDESDEEKNSNDVKMDSHGIEDDLDIQIDVNSKNLRSFELNIVDNISVGTDSSANVQILVLVLIIL